MTHFSIKAEVVTSHGSSSDKKKRTYPPEY